MDPVRSIGLGTEPEPKIKLAFPVDIHKWQNFKNEKDFEKLHPNESINDTFHVDQPEDNSPRTASQGMISRIVSKMNWGPLD